MLSKIDLKNFKCFSNLQLPLKKLNVFSGLNSMGKSTVIQSLLILQQSLVSNYILDKIILNGNLVKLGTSSDIFYKDSEEQFMEITLYSNDGKQSFLKIPYEEKKDILKISEDSSKIDKISNGFEYINAERLAPKTIYEKSSYFVNNLNQIGIYGEYAVDYLINHGSDIINVVNANNATLSSNVEYWLGKISPDISLVATDLPKTNSATISYRFKNYNDVISDEYMPINVGFGISYCLPVIVSLLKAKPEDLLILENPESHLHPRGQSSIGYLLALVAASGVQIILETHSDHIINGIRVAVKDRNISHSDVSFDWFSKKIIGKKVSSDVETIQIDKNGELSEYPDGFLDEWDSQLGKLL